VTALYLEVVVFISDSLSSHCNDLILFLKSSQITSMTIFCSLGRHLTSSPAPLFHSTAPSFHRLYVVPNHHKIPLSDIRWATEKRTEKNNEIWLMETILHICSCILGAMLFTITNRMQYPRNIICRQLFTPMKIPGKSCRGWVDPRATMQLEGLAQMENPLTSSAMEPVTFRLVP
jgi:hypothetical protein